MGSVGLRALLYRACRVICLWLFFFQAEDGIRDVAVTGVQTCALPISGPLGLLAPLGSRPAAYAQSVRRHAPLEVPYSVRIDDYVSSFHSRFLFLDPSILPCRSEERRVGKESSSRWSREN